MQGVQLNCAKNLKRGPAVAGHAFRIAHDVRLTRACRQFNRAAYKYITATSEYVAQCG